MGQDLTGADTVPPAAAAAPNITAAYAGEAITGFLAELAEVLRAIQDACGSGRQCAPQHVLSTPELQAPLTHTQPGVLLALGVVREHARFESHHVPIMGRTLGPRATRLQPPSD
ncbi:hypothetical protein [Streptomyces sp. NBC_01285]|uniref:hypothetical protein n=1 Tax=Streptomyces sp. NBC_01285 TaxID=2903813 RepID=UPI00224DD8BD|nr:hypothetical protein [Streptomyces sp. NBC_01285]MCX4774503.1 hypothetical protein [Streptomyces sp. NBC_01285]